MRPVQYIFLNRDLGMSTGKAAAQVAHAACLAVASQPEDDPLVREWWESGHYTKLVMEARDSLHMLTIERYLMVRGIVTFMVIDEGRTEIAPHQMTAMAVELVDKDDPRTELIFAGFKLYRDRPQEPKRTWPFWTNFSRRKRNRN